MTDDDDVEARRRRIAANIAKALGKTADVRVEGGKVLAFKRPGDDDGSLMEEATALVRQARAGLADDAQRRRLADIRARRDGESDDEWRARMKLWGLDDE